MYSYIIGDSGGNQAGMKAVAEELSAKWAGGKTTIHFIPEYYDYPGTYKWADQAFGWEEKVEGIHDDPTITTIMMTVNPDLVRIREREARRARPPSTASHSSPSKRPWSRGERSSSTGPR